MKGLQGFYSQSRKSLKRHIHCFHKPSVCSSDRFSSLSRFKKLHIDMKRSKKKRDLTAYKSFLSVCAVIQQYVNPLPSHICIDFLSLFSPSLFSSVFPPHLSAGYFDSSDPPFAFSISQRSLFLSLPFLAVSFSLSHVISDFLSLRLTLSFSVSLRCITLMFGPVRGGPWRTN